MEFIAVVVGNVLFAKFTRRGNFHSESTVISVWRPLEKNSVTLIFFTL